MVIVFIATRKELLSSTNRLFFYLVFTMIIFIISFWIKTFTLKRRCVDIRIIVGLVGWPFLSLMVRTTLETKPPWFMSRAAQKEDKQKKQWVNVPSTSDISSFFVADLFLIAANLKRFWHFSICNSALWALTYKAHCPERKLHEKQIIYLQSKQHVTWSNRNQCNTRTITGRYL